MNHFELSSDFSGIVPFPPKSEESEDRFKVLGDLMPYPIWLAAPNGTLIYFNQAIYDYSGLKPEDMGNDRWINIVHPEDRENNIATWMHSVLSGEEFLFEHRFLRYDGAYRWHISRGIPQRNIEGDIELWVGTTLDIQDQKIQNQQLEKKVKERTFELVRKNKELEQFAYVASHDMQEPLRKIQTFISILLNSDTTNLNDSQKQLFYRIDSAAFRLKNIIKDILYYSHETGVGDHFITVNLNEVMRLVENDLELIINEKKARIVYQNLPEVIAIPGQMNQLFYNLIHNSLKFSNPVIPPVINIEYSSGPLNESEYREFQRQIVFTKTITITDNGVGFDEKDENRIFGLFQRLHNKNSFLGSGIGLALCKKIANNHKWNIKAKSVLGEGTCIEIGIP